MSLWRPYAVELKRLLTGGASQTTLTPDELFELLIQEEAKLLSRVDERFLPKQRQGKLPQAHQVLAALLALAPMPNHAAPVLYALTEQLTMSSWRALPREFIPSILEDEALLERFDELLDHLDAPQWLRAEPLFEAPSAPPAPFERLTEVLWLSADRCDQLDALFMELEPELWDEAYEELDIKPRTRQKLQLIFGELELLGSMCSERELELLCFLR